MVTLFEGSLRILAELCLYLFGPVTDCGFENGRLVLGGGLLRLGHIRGRQGEACSTLNEAQGHLGMSQELMEVVH